MNLLSRVVWSEGMHLAQHHFQAQSRYFEDLIAFAFSTLFFKPYGLTGLELDPEALTNGTVSLTHARGIMPDGLAFQFPEDPLPDPLDILDSFSPTQDGHVVLLAIHRFRPRQANHAPAAEVGAAVARFTGRTRPISDEITGQDEKPVELARKNFRLLLDTDSSDDLVCLPLARVRRSGSGHFIYDPAFIPPCIQIGASDALMQLVGRLIDRLDAKAAALIAQRQASRTTLAEYASREIADFWLSHTLHSSLPILRHLFQSRSCHPEALFTEVSRLAGALCTFALHSHPRSLPLYDHDDLGSCFGMLERHIREHLEVVLPTRSLTIPLRQANTGQLEASSELDAQTLDTYRDFLIESSPYFHLGSVTDGRCFGQAHWFLGVRSAAGAGDLITRVPTLVKMCSAKHIARLVRDAFPGMKLEHTPVPPAEVSPRTGTQYFRVQTAGPCWLSITQTGQVGVYVPAAIPDAQLELTVVPES